MVRVAEALRRLANRSDNLLATSILVLGGAVFGFIVFQEQDLPDKVDDGGFLLVAVVIIAWYLWSDNSFKPSLVPVVLAVVDVLAQVAGLIIEREDPKAFGDNIGGIVYFGAALLLILFQRRRTRELLLRLGETVSGAAP